MARILVIDDNEDFRDMLCTMLEREGYEVIMAEDGQKGIDHLRKTPSDLVISDIVMPNKEGIETIIELHKDYPEIKIIAISGGGRGDAKGYLEAAKLFGAHRIFPKPFAIDELLEAIKELLI